MRLNGHPSRPSAITCCRFSSLKTLLTSMENTSTAVNVLLQFRWPVFRRPSLAGFERPPRLCGCRGGSAPCQMSATPSSRGRRLLIGRNSDQRAIESNGPVDRGKLMSRRQPARVPSGAHDAVVPPEAVRFAIQKVDRLHLTRMEECHKEIAHDADILYLED